jgi:hypothetical protein
MFSMGSPNWCSVKSAGNRQNLRLGLTFSTAC